MNMRGITRRSVIGMGLCAGAGIVAAGWATAAEEEDVSAGEDLMREHGALVRILLVYGECARRLRSGPQQDASALGQAAAIVRRFVEGYHEKIEEKYVFPRFEKSRELGELVHVLKAQHYTGRNVTRRIEELAASGFSGGQREEAAALAESFSRMYYPHLAREDTVLFPAYRASMSRKQYSRMGDRFEDMERGMLGNEGFEHTLTEIESLEKNLGIFDLSRFTPAT